MDTPTVVALILTHNSHAALARCLDALAGQTHRPDRVLVVDNASAAPVGDVDAHFPGTEVRRLDDNLGPAGGHAVGLQHFFDTTTADSWAWVLDDDCVPEPTALERLLVTATAVPSPTLVFANIIDTDAHEDVVGVGWWGVLIPRAAVAEAGVPMAELFWWAEDTEYLQWRLPRAGFAPLYARDAIVRVDRSRASRAKPAWKYYYEARNTVYYRFRIQRRSTPHSMATLRNLGRRTWKTTRSISKLAWRALFVERAERPAKLAMVVRGTADGVRGRLGRPVPATVPDRPIVAVDDGAGE